MKFTSVAFLMACAGICAAFPAEFVERKDAGADSIAFVYTIKPNAIPTHVARAPEPKENGADSVAFVYTIKPGADAVPTAVAREVEVEARAEPDTEVNTDASYSYTIVVSN